MIKNKTLQIKVTFKKHLEIQKHFENISSSQFLKIVFKNICKQVLSLLGVYYQWLHCGAAEYHQVYTMAKNKKQKNGHK